MPITSKHLIMKYYLLFILIIFFTSCKRILLIAEGIKQPKLENQKSLSNFLLKKEIDTLELLCFKDTTALNTLYRKKIVLPDSRFFNNKRELVPYKSSPEDCNGKVAVFLEQAESINKSPSVPDERLETFLQDVVYENDLRPFSMEPDNYDFYLVIYWAKYLGKVNKHKVFDWLNLVEEARKRGMKIRVIKVNADYQGLWGLKKRDLPHFEY